MPEITLRDIYQSQQALLGSFKDMQTDQREVRDSLTELKTDQREVRDSLTEVHKNQQEMRGSLVETQRVQKEMQVSMFGMQRSIQELSEAQQETLTALHAFATHVDGQFTEIRATMVSKDYLDNKLADLRGDLVLLARKGNTKLSTLVERLVEEKRLDPEVAHQILLMEPFPQA